MNIDNIIEVETVCYQTYPCQHYVKVIQNNELKRILMPWTYITLLAKRINFDLSHINCYKCYSESEINRLLSFALSKNFADK